MAERVIGKKSQSVRKRGLEELVDMFILHNKRDIKKINAIVWWNVNGKLKSLVKRVKYFQNACAVVWMHCQNNVIYVSLVDRQTGTNSIQSPFFQISENKIHHYK